MTTAIVWLITLSVAALLLAFVPYLWSMGQNPTGDRPRVRRYDRFGEALRVAENPDYHVNPGEGPVMTPDHVPSQTDHGPQSEAQ